MSPLPPSVPLEFEEEAPLASRKHSPLKLRQGFAASYDNTRIHYRALGRGFPIVVCNGLGVPHSFFKYFEKYFSRDYQVVLPEYRGHGKSDLPEQQENVSVEALVEDCRAALDHLKIKKAVFLGYSLGTQVLFEFYRRYPDRIALLIPCLGTYGHPFDTFYNGRFAKYVYDLIVTVGTFFPKQGNRLSRFLLKIPIWYELGGLLKMVDPQMADKKDVEGYVQHFLDRDPVFFTRLVQAIQAHTAEDVLPTIKVPTLIVSAENDQFTPSWISRKMHRLIPESELFIAKKATHAAIVEMPDWLNLRIEKFLQDHHIPKKKSARPSNSSSGRRKESLEEERVNPF